MRSTLEGWDLTVDEHSSEAAGRIADAFNSYFSNWSIQVSPSDIRPGARDSLAQRGWGINYVVETDDHGDLCLEFYATHRMTDDRHVLISSSGEMTHLDAITGMFMYDPKVGGDKERASRRNIEHNRRVAEELERKGLYPAGDVNAFLRTGGMEGSDTLKEMHATLSGAHLPMPFVPEKLRDEMYPVRRWCWATRDVEPFDMYYFDRYLVEAVAASPDDYLAFCHAGHGINSYAITYQLVIGRVALFVQVPWGGGYMNKERQALAVSQMLEGCSELLARVPELPDGPRLLVAISKLRGHRLCGWIPSGMDEEGAREWLGSDELSVPDPLDHATLLLA